MAEKFFKVPFANEGDKLSVPDVIQADGSISFAQGYGFDYERDQATDPQAKDISRESFNSLLYDITSVLGDIQRTGVQPYMSEITYSKGSIVWFNEELYVSLSNSNTSAPPSDKWTILYDKTNTTVDKNNFIRAEGSKTTVVTDDITHDENETSREKVASAELVSKKITGGGVIQTTGQSTTDVMSQKGVTDAINSVKTTANKVARGWRKDPNTGLIEQWGTESISDRKTTIKFPISFTKPPFFIMTNHFKNNEFGNSDKVNISSRDNIQFVAQIRTPNNSSLAGLFDWYAIGE